MPITVVAKTDPAYRGSSGLFRSGFDLVRDLLTLFFLFSLNRSGHTPGRIFPHLDNRKPADRGLPLLARLPDRDRIRPAQATTLKVKEHPLRKVDLDQIGCFERNDSDDCRYVVRFAGFPAGL